MRFENSSALRVTAFVSVLLGIAAVSASAAPITVIDFDADSSGNKSNGFVSSGTTGVHFSDTVGSDLIVFSDATVTNGSQGLGVWFDDGDSALLIEIDFLASAISMDIGNDNPLFAPDGSKAVLTAMIDGVIVGTQELAFLDPNSLMDQTITFELEGVVFNQVILEYVVTGPSTGLIEVVDNVRVTNAIPEPGAAMVFGVGMLVIGRALRRRSNRVLARPAR